MGRAEDHPPGDTPVGGFVARPVQRWRKQRLSQEHDSIAEEVPVAMVYNGVSFAVMMATPQDLEDFALGFSLSEGLIDTPAQLLDVEEQHLLEGITLALTVHADAPAAQLAGAAQRLLPGRSGCGVCGTRDLERAVRQPAPVTARLQLDWSVLEAALARMQGMQPINAATGAVHAAAWCDATGEVPLLREDVGRHNALDKLVGALWRQHLTPADGVLMVTSRASYEMVTKAVAAGAGILVAISAPTALAVELARSAGLTLVGFARPGSHNVYTHPWRLRYAAMPGEH